MDLTVEQQFQLKLFAKAAGEMDRAQLEQCLLELIRQNYAIRNFVSEQAKKGFLNNLTV